METLSILGGVLKLILGSFGGKVLLPSVRAPEWEKGAQGAEAFCVPKHCPLLGVEVLELDLGAGLSEPGKAHPSSCWIPFRHSQRPALVFSEVRFSPAYPM